MRCDGEGEAWGNMDKDPWKIFWNILHPDLQNDADSSDPDSQQCRRIPGQVIVGGAGWWLLHAVS